MIWQNTSWRGHSIHSRCPNATSKQRDKYLRRWGSFFLSVYNLHHSVCWVVIHVVRPHARMSSAPNGPVSAEPFNKPDCPGDLESQKIRLDTSLGLSNIHSVQKVCSHCPTCYPPNNHRGFFSSSYTPPNGINQGYPWFRSYKIRWAICCSALSYYLCPPGRCHPVKASTRF